MFDLHFLSLNQSAGIWQAELPNFYATMPVKPVRLRANERLGLFSTIPLPAHQQRELLERLSEGYYRYEGTVTSALRSLVERLNDFLLSRNLKQSLPSAQQTGSLLAMVVRGSSLYFVVSGTAQAFLVRKEGIQHWYDAAGRPLGQAKIPSLRFFREEIREKDLLILAPEPYWKPEALMGIHALGEEGIRQRLQGDLVDFSCGLVRFTSGKGEIHWHLPSVVRQTPAKSDLETKAPEKETSLSTEPVIVPQAISLSGKRWEGVSGHSPRLEQKESEESRVLEKNNLEKGAEEKPVVSARPVKSGKQKQSTFAMDWQPVLKAFAAFLHRLEKGWGTVRQILRKFGQRVLPHPAGVEINLSPGVMLAIALLVPLLMAAVGATVYLERGRNEQNRAYLATARQFVAQAESESDPALKRQKYLESLEWWEKSGTFKNSEEGRNVFTTAQNGLDQLDGVKRLTFRPALRDGLPPGVHISRMVAYLNDVYALDQTSGRVFRLIRSGNDYELDLSFVCGPGMAGGRIINPLVDIAPAPQLANSNATVMGIDSAGNLVFCSPGASTMDLMVLRAPGMGWGKIQHITMNNRTLYVLDPMSNMVYVYRASPTTGFSPDDDPNLYFGNDTPPLNEVVDLVADVEHLYLLHQDGRMSICSHSGFEVECNHVAEYGDNRPGKSGEVERFEEVQFVRMQATQLPEPFIYILDASENAVYQFSQRKLNFQQQFRNVEPPQVTFPKESPTAFVVTPNRRLVLAFGNELFFAIIQ